MASSDRRETAVVRRLWIYVDNQYNATRILHSLTRKILLRSTSANIHNLKQRRCKVCRVSTRICSTNWVSLCVCCGFRVLGAPDTVSVPVLPPAGGDSGTNRHNTAEPRTTGLSAELAERVPSLSPLGSTGRAGQHVQGISARAANRSRLSPRTYKDSLLIAAWQNKEMHKKLLDKIAGLIFVTEHDCDNAVAKKGKGVPMSQYQ